MNFKQLGDPVERITTMRNVPICAGFYLHQAEEPTGERISVAPPIHVNSVIV